MADDGFRAIIARRDAETGNVSVQLEMLRDSDLPSHGVTIDVEYSSLNYKDGMALQNKNRILRSFPIIPGIDFAGTVRDSNTSEYARGDNVILTGWAVGEKWSGGFSERARAEPGWLVKTPEGMSNRMAMMIGTAGLTAMLCVMELERAGRKPGENILVTGASGGVGSVAVKLLAKLGYHVTALTGRAEQHEFLRSLGAAEIISRVELEVEGKPLQSERWHGCIDTVGGIILANALASMAYDGAIAACGLAASMELHTTVAPFIIRNVSLRGVDSVLCPKSRRVEAWDRLAKTLSVGELAELSTEVNLENVIMLGDEILQGKIRGRTLIRMPKAVK